MASRISHLFRLALTALGLLASLAAPAGAQAPSPTEGPASIGEEVTFTSGASILSGSVLVPPEPGPHPAVVMLEGSGAYSYRRAWREGVFPFWKTLADSMVARGFVVLLFDKPGINRSTGNWRTQSFEDRAADALAAVRYLRSRPEVDGARIGLMGHSQGGYVAPVAAVRAGEEVAFVVSLAGPAVGVQRQIADDLANGWQCGGSGAAGVWVRRKGLRAALSGLGLVARVAKPSYLSRIINHDPAPYLARVTQPMLALFAENDPLVPPPANVRRWRAAASRGGNRAVFIRTVPGADHGFEASAPCAERGRARGFAPGFFPALFDSAFWAAVGARAGRGPAPAAEHKP